MRVAGRFPWSTMGLRNADCHSLRPGGSLCRTGCSVCEQLGALRLYRCQRCGRVVLICSRCDCNQRYCADDCAQQARRESLRRAGQRYQQTHRGKCKHAARMDRYRKGQTQKVTHQTPLASRASVPTSPSGASPLPEQEDSDVLQQPVPILPSTLVPPQSSLVRASALRAATAPTEETTPGPLHRCHFCGSTCSPLVRRDSLCDLRRRLAQRAARAASPPSTSQRSPPCVIPS
jgi:hypothetical protein